jgi:DNA-binding HxlR family transcriptional regulator
MEELEMANAPYGLFCPLAKASEVLEKRWTLLILGEMWEGASRFNDLRRSVPGISPTLLTKRLRELEENGLVERVEDTSKGTIDYVRTPKAIELEPALQMLSDWAYRHVEKDMALKDVNADYLLWNIYQKIDTSVFRNQRVVIRFHLTDVPDEEAVAWFIAGSCGSKQICTKDPRFDVDLYIEAQSTALASAFMGYSTLEHEQSGGNIFVTGDAYLIRHIDDWLIKSCYADPDFKSSIAPAGVCAGEES